MTTPLLNKEPIATSIVQIFEVSDAHAQELIVGLLRGVASMTVSASSRGQTLLVSTACADDHQAASVFRFVTSIDYNACLDYATHQPARSLVA